MQERTSECAESASVLLSDRLSITIQGGWTAEYFLNHNKIHCYVLSMYVLARLLRRDDRIMHDSLAGMLPPRALLSTMNTE